MDEILKYLSLHEHVLYLKRVWLEDDQECSLCGTLIDGPTYHCRSCVFYVHEACYHNRLHHHAGKSIAQCSCRKTGDRCNNCEIRQQSVRNSRKCQGISYQSKHCGDPEHRLFLFRSKGDKRCDLCGGGLSKDSPYYGCQVPIHGFHVSCVSLPEEIHGHPIHPNCPLKLQPWVAQEKKIQCKVCGGDIDSVVGLYYSCENCVGIQIHHKCCRILPSIRYWNHPHPLVSVERPPGSREIFCCECRKTSSSDICRCVRGECQYYAHKKCLTLPESVLVRGVHNHSLRFSLIGSDGGSQMDPDELYCDVCEEKRSRRQAVYSCHYCPGPFVSHVACTLRQHSNPHSSPTDALADEGMAIAYVDTISNEIKKLRIKGPGLSSFYRQSFDVRRKMAELHTEIIQLDDSWKPSRSDPSALTPSKSNSRAAAIVAQGESSVRKQTSRTKGSPVKKSVKISTQKGMAKSGGNNRQKPKKEGGQDKKAKGREKKKEKDINREKQIKIATQQKQSHTEYIS